MVEGSLDDRLDKVRELLREVRPRHAGSTEAGEPMTPLARPVPAAFAHDPRRARRGLRISRAQPMLRAAMLAGSGTAAVWMEP